MSANGSANASTCSASGTRSTSAREPTYAATPSPAADSRQKLSRSASSTRTAARPTLSEKAHTISANTVGSRSSLPGVCACASSPVTTARQTVPPSSAPSAPPARSLPLPYESTQMHSSRHSPTVRRPSMASVRS